MHTCARTHTHISFQVKNLPTKTPRNKVSNGKACCTVPQPFSPSPTSSTLNTPQFCLEKPHCQAAENFWVSLQPRSQLRPPTKKFMNVNWGHRHISLLRRNWTEPPATASQPGLSEDCENCTRAGGEKYNARNDLESGAGRRWRHELADPKCLFHL